LGEVGDGIEDVEGAAEGGECFQGGVAAEERFDEGDGGLDVGGGDKPREGEEGELEVGGDGERGVVGAEEELDDGVDEGCWGVGVGLGEGGGT
jgi:hypothetical protein